MLPTILLALLIGFFGGYASAAVGGRSGCPLSGAQCAQFGNFWRAWQLATDKYVDAKAIDPQKMVDGAISGMLASLGDTGHTRYLPASEAKAERESLAGKFEGIGAFISMKDGDLVITAPIDGSPAERAGIRAGDIILRVDGVDVSGLAVDQLTSKVRGPKGTRVTLTVRHVGATEPVDIVVIRDEIKVTSVSWSMLPQRVAMIHINRFSAGTSDEFKAALAAAQKAGATSIVLDLRNNPGGFVDELIQTADQLLPPNSTVLIEADRAGTRTPRTTGASSVPTTLPLVVLVNENTASAAEILAGALKDDKRAEVIGVNTFGTATVLSLFDLDGGAQVRLGTSQWLTPSGAEVRGKGITPTQRVALNPGVSGLSNKEAAALPLADLLSGQDTQLAAALRALGKK